MGQTLQVKVIYRRQTLKVRGMYWGQTLQMQNLVTKINFNFVQGQKDRHSDKATLWIIELLTSQLKSFPSSKTRLPGCRASPTSSSTPPWSPGSQCTWPGTSDIIKWGENILRDFSVIATWVNCFRTHETQAKRIWRIITSLDITREASSFSVETFYLNLLKALITHWLLVGGCVKFWNKGGSMYKTKVSNPVVTMNVSISDHCQRWDRIIKKLSLHKAFFC